MVLARSVCVCVCFPFWQILFTQGLSNYFLHARVVCRGVCDSSILAKNMNAAATAMEETQQLTEIAT